MSLMLSQKLKNELKVELSVRITPYTGRGVFAEQDIPKDTIVERAHVIYISEDQIPHLEKTTFDNYCFFWDRSNPEKTLALALGYGSLYNHSYAPNAIFNCNFEKQTIDFIAYREIKQGEEICINYNGDPESQEPLWFPTCGEKS